MKQEVLINEFILPLWQEKNIQVIDNFVSPTADIQTTLFAGYGPTTLRLYAEALFKAFTVFEWSIEHVMRRESQVVYQWRVNAVQTGFLLNTQPSHRLIEFSGMVLAEIKEGLITQYHCFTNLSQVLSQQPALQSASPSNKTLHNLCDLQSGVSFDKEYLITLVREATGKRLTIREVECLWFWLKGFSIKNTAKILGGLSSRTIQTFRENIKRKLDVENYQELLSVIQASGIMPVFIETILPADHYLERA